MLKSKYLAILYVHGQPTIKENNASKEEAKKWIDAEIDKLKLSYPNWPWEKQWKIIPYTKIIEE